VPVIQVHVSTVQVVGFQDLPDEHKKIHQPALLEGPAYRQPAVAFAEMLIPHMGMRDIGVH
jgi:hypothetical protein